MATQIGPTNTDLAIIVASGADHRLRCVRADVHIAALGRNELFLLTPDTGVQPSLFATVKILLAKRGAVHAGTSSSGDFYERGPQ